jgi:small subunit ribosomal protein S20
LPITKSAEKEMRVSQRRAAVNKATRSKAKTMITKAESDVASGAQGTAATVKAAVSALDRAAGKGVIHPNNAARRKSRLMKKANQSAKKPS